MSLMASLRANAGALRAFEKVLETCQNNVANASTAGYARQRVDLVANPFQPADGAAGGVTARSPVSERNQYAEQNVRRQVQLLGYEAAREEILGTIESAFDVSGESGLSGALNDLWSAFSTWADAPSSSSARQGVLDHAAALGESFASAAALIQGTAEDASRALSETVGKINALAGKIAGVNANIRQGHRDDGGLEATLHASLEELAELVDINVLENADGSVTVLAGGSIALVVGDHTYSLQVAASPETAAEYADGQPHMAVLDTNGNEVTGSIGGGRLRGLLEVRNEVIPGLIGDGSQQGDLNRLAQAVADRVNQLLAGGETEAGAAPLADLFVYDASNPTGVAFSLSLNPDFECSELAAADPGPPYVDNGIARKLAALSRPQAEEDKLDGVSYAEFYAGTASVVGRALSSARENQDLGEQMAAQARSLRQTVSGVSLDEEAMVMIQFQRAYQAASKMITILDELTETAVNLIS